MASNVTEFAKGKAKQVATHFLTKLIESFEPDKDDKNTGSTAPPGTGHTGKPNQSPSPGAYGPDLSDSFNSMSISNNHNYGPPPGSNDPSFVGGWNPQYVNNGHGYSSQSAVYAQSTPAPYGSYPSGPSPSNQYPGPQSNTMQLALQSDEDNLAPWKESSSPSPSSKPSKPPKPQDIPSKKPQTPASPAPSSTSSKPPKAAGSKPSTGKNQQVQCAGVTKAGKKCTRMVKVADIDSDGDGEEDTKFCHQHSKEVLTGNSGFYSRKNGEWVKFEDWIPPYLQPEIQVALRCEMERNRSNSDVPGYIYTFEIREDSDGDTIKLKVGRAVNLVKRIDQWGKQCGSKEQVLRGFYPGSVEADEGGASMMKGRVQAGEKGPWCHRLERLIHLELGDLVRTSIYLDPKWPKVEFDDWEERNPDGVKTAPIHGPCSDCGSMHKEIFEFERWKTGKNKGKEWQTLVKGVIDRWGRFVELYV